MSQPAPSSPKKTLQKKRHTKPCRYFQTGSCPHPTQEDCDFAHVFNDSASMPTTKRCGCYPQGTSTNGIWCQYGYGEEIAEDVPLLQDSAYGMVPMDEIVSPKAPLSAELYSSTGPFPHPQSPRTPIHRKLAKYRTKSCRYFKPGSVCLKGDAFTFIHAEPDRSDEVQDTPAEAVKLQHELPSKPVSTKDENTRKDYFPISWGVIGGGVLLRDAKAEPSLSVDSESDLSEDSFLGHADPASRALEIEISASAPPSAVAFPFSDSNADTDDSMTPTGLPSRQHASSIPSTPITTHVDLLHLFSAESPGTL